MSLFLDKRGRSKIPLAKSRLFWAGLAVKLIIACCFASEYLRDLFVPFSNYFIGSGFEDPYSYFVQNGNGNEFPYPPLMLWLFSLPRTILWPLLPGSTDVFTIWDSLIYRLPLLIADFTILIILIRWLKTRTRQVLIWYWLSPVLIYINYFHGQLDVIPMAFMMMSLYLLFKNKWPWAFVCLGLAIACKTNMVLVVPFYGLYLFRASQIKIQTVVLSLFSLVLPVLLINAPYITSEGMLQMVYNNPVQQQIFDLYYQFNSTLKIYFIPAIYFTLVLYYFTFKFVNRDQLVLFLAFTFLALTLMIAPMQGWYYWIMPLMVYFVIKQGVREKYLLIVLSVLYFVYFGLIKDSDYLIASNFYSGMSIEMPSGKALNIAFTLLQTTLVLLAYLVYKNGITNNIQTKFLSQPYMIGIGGDSASGKSTLSNALADVFEVHNTSIIRGDDMHKWERGNDNWNVYTHLDPRANKLHEDLEHARVLKSGRSIKRRNYDHSTGKFTLPKFIQPNKLIVFEGLHSFYLSNQAEVYDLKVFMEPDDQLRMWWKVQRDVAKRGYSPEKVLEQLKMREQDSEKYIKTQASQADIIAKFYPLNDIDPVNQTIEPIIALKITLSNEIYPDPLLEQLKSVVSLSMDHVYANDHQELIFKGTISKEQIELIADKCIPELEDIGIYNTDWKDNFEGMLQLVTTFVIFNRLKNKELNA
jgi:uridine kinase/Gpi18-like mannosyltransferase